MIGSLVKLIFSRLVPVLVLSVAVLMGWCNLDPVYPWEARFFVVVIPVLQGYLPPAWFGHGRLGAKMTPPVPDDMVPRARPAGELFATLPGSGDKMPLVGNGMCCRPTAYDDVCVERTIEWFLLLGGRHIDGAHLYMNHGPIGRGMKNAIAKGIPRSEIFMTTKVYPTHFGYQATRDTILSSLADLGEDYVDLVLLHAPSRMFPGPGAAGCKGLTKEECRKESWRALSDLRNEGKIRNAGVSNFAIPHLQQIIELYDTNHTEIAPIANNQVQWNPWAPFDMVEIVDFCKSHDIQITGYNSLGGSFEKEKAVDLETLKRLSEAHARPIHQILLRWSLQTGTAIIPGTGNPKYMEDNLRVYDFELSEEDMAGINGLREELQGQFFTMTPRED